MRIRPAAPSATPSGAPAGGSGAEPRHFSVPGFDVLLGTHPAASVLPRHTHDVPTLCCVQHGRFTEYYPGKAVACDERMVKVTPAGEPHWNRFEGVDTTGMRIDIDPARFDDVPAIRRMLDERIFVSESAFGTLAQRLITELAAPDEASVVAAESMLLELLVVLSRRAPARGAGRPEWLARADELVRDEFREPVRLSTVAAAVGVHPTTLARAYRRAYGVTIGERVRALRIEWAAHQLATSRDPLSTIALQSGFYDQSHFTNVFREHMRMTPASYRRRARAIRH